MRRTALTFLSFLMAALPAASSARERVPQGESLNGPLPVFELRSGFWINFHHFLYQLAREKRDANAPKIASRSVTGLSEAEQRDWDAAVSYYAAHFADKDLLFNSDLVSLKDLFGDFERCDELSGKTRKECNAGFPPALADALERASSVYRSHFWPAHDAENRRWIAHVAPLVRQRGLELAQRLAEIYQTKWPREKIRVDVCAYANWAGAYTTLDPLRVTISSLDPRNQHRAALEVLFHEASHGIADPVQQAILRECRQLGKPIPRDLWHALLFYTTGEVVKSVLDPPPPRPSSSSSASGGSPAPGAYVPYAVREGLYTRRWESYQQLLQRFWQPYLDGRADFDDAIVRMVSAL